MSVKINGSETKKDIIISEAAADRLISMTDRNALRLFLFTAKNGGEADPESAKKALSISDGEYTSASAALAREGLAQADEKTAREETPDSVISGAERAFGRMLRRNEAESVAALFESSGIAADAFVILMLFSAARQTSRRFGQRSVSIYQLSKDASEWASKGLFTASDADTYIKEQTRLDRETERMQAESGVFAATAYELAAFRGWADDGFGARAVKTAADIAEKNGHKGEVAYIGRVVRQWRENGVFSPEEIERYQQSRELEKNGRAVAQARRNGGKRPSGTKTLSRSELESIAETENYIETGGDGDGV